jgi:hypothetical protein
MPVSPVGYNALAGSFIDLLSRVGPVIGSRFIFGMAIKHIPVDCRERGEICIGQGLWALRVGGAWQRLSANVDWSSH